MQWVNLGRGRVFPPTPEGRLLPAWVGELEEQREGERKEEGKVGGKGEQDDLKSVYALSLSLFLSLSISLYLFLSL